MAHALRLDTLKFSRKLAEAGLEPRVADAIVEGLAEVETPDYATKADLNEAKAALSVDLAAVKAELKADIRAVKDLVSDLRADMFKQFLVMGVTIVGLTVSLIKFLP